MIIIAIIKSILSDFVTHKVLWFGFEGVCYMSLKTYTPSLGIILAVKGMIPIFRDFHNIWVFAWQNPKLFWNFGEMNPCLGINMQEIRPIFKGFLVKCSPLEQHIPVCLRVWSPILMFQLFVFKWFVCLFVFFFFVYSVVCFSSVCRATSKLTTATKEKGY